MLNYIKIENWKAFVDEDLKFEEGINFIVGRNGVGKTTVLEAICLAMSGDTTHSDFLSLVRDKRKPARIELSFRVDSKEYLVRRQFSNKSKQKSELTSEGKSLCSNWDPVSNKVMELLDIESTFFRRLTYMSEGEIYKYLREPPEEALNRRIQYIFGIDNLLAVEERLNEIRISFTNSIANTKIDLEKLLIEPNRMTRDLADLEKELEKQEKIKKEIDDQKREIEGKITEIKESMSWFRKAKQIAERLINTIGDEKELDEAGSKPLKVIHQLIQKTDSLVSDIEKNIIVTQKNIGSFENKKKYFEDIKKLLSSLEDTINTHTSVPCPICKRPISKDMGKHLIDETKKEIRQAEEELSDLFRKIEKLEIDLRKEKAKKSIREECRIQLSNFPKKIVEEAREMSPSQIEAKIKMLENSITDYDNEVKKNGEKSSLIETKIKTVIQDISDIKAERRNILLKRGLENKLIKAHKGEMLANISALAVKNTRINITNFNLEQPFTIVSDLFHNFRPERNLRIMPTSKGIIKISDENKSYMYEDLSGGEKTVLLVLLRVILCRALSRVSFLMIDEPLEHLDIRNRRSLLNFLSIANKGNIIPQIILTTFEETLLRKLFYDERVKIKFLQ